MLTDETSVIRYSIASGVTSYAIPFAYWDKEEIVVKITESDLSLTTLTLNTDYSLSTPDGESGTLTKLTDWGDATKLTIIRKVDTTQEKDFINGQTIDAEEVEESLDKLTAIVQEHKEHLTRTVKVPEDEAGTDITLPPKSVRKGSSASGAMIGFGPDGVTMLSRDLAQFDSDVSAAAASAAAAAISETNAGQSESKAKTSETNAKTSEDNAKSSETKAKTSENNAKSSETNASTYRTAAGNSATAAATSEGNAEAWAVGQRGGTDVPQTDPTYHNNSKYYAGIVEDRMGPFDFSKNTPNGGLLPAIIPSEDSRPEITDLMETQANRSVTDLMELEESRSMTELFETEAHEDRLLSELIPKDNEELVCLHTVASAPASMTAEGLKGQVYYDTDYLYICVATNTWRRVALSTF